MTDRDNPLAAFIEASVWHGGVVVPSGYTEVDELLRSHGQPSA